MNTIRRIKEELKTSAKTIREYKAAWKELQRGNLLWQAYYEKFKDADSSHYWRHKYIAYCMLRGKSYEQIEQKVRPGNEVDMSFVQSFLDLWKEELANEQAVRTGA